MPSSATSDVCDLVAERVGLEWCLFLDRDGVLNRRVVGDYVRSWSDFELLPGVEAALRTLTRWAPHTVVITNQQGVGKGLMSPEQLESIHARFLERVAAADARIESVLSCMHREDEACACRKPRPGLALTWLREHPSVAAARSVMVGDAASDVAMAHNLAEITGGCTALMVGDAVTDVRPDARFDSLADLAAHVDNCMKGETR